MVLQGLPDCDELGELFFVDGSARTQLQSGFHLYNYNGG